MAISAFFALVVGLLLPDDVSFSLRLSDVFNTLLVSFVLLALAWVLFVFGTYVLFGLRLSLFPRFFFSGDKANKKPKKKVHFNDAMNEILNLKFTKQGRQLFVEGYKQGYKDAKMGKGSAQKDAGSESWDKAAEGAIVHLRESFVHGENEN